MAITQQQLNIKQITLTLRENEGTSVVPGGGGGGTCLDFFVGFLE